MNKKLFNNLLLNTGRPGIDKLIEYLKTSGFYEAPCSTNHHLCREGGLLDHSLNVYETMDKFNVAVGAELPQDSIVICSLLHDLGKAGQFGKLNYVPNYLKNKQISAAKPYEVNKDLLPMNHEDRSIQIASKYIDLMEDETWAIIMHNGLYGNHKYEIPGHETKMYLLLHFADMYCSRILENEGDLF